MLARCRTIRVGFPYGDRGKVALNKGLALRVVRIMGFVVLAVAAVVVTLVMAPEPVEAPDTDRFDRLIDQALDDNRANDARTDTAPQQQVVNGWVARDLLTIMAQQQTEQLATASTSASDERVPYLLLVAVLAIVWHGATQPRRSEPAAAVALPSGNEMMAKPAPEESTVGARPDDSPQP